jgi:hypothetical protein
MPFSSALINCFSQGGKDQYSAPNGSITILGCTSTDEFVNNRLYFGDSASALTLSGTGGTQAVESVAPFKVNRTRPRVPSDSFTAGSEPLAAFNAPSTSRKVTAAAVNGTGTITRSMDLSNDTYAFLINQTPTPTDKLTVTLSKSGVAGATSAFINDPLAAYNTKFAPYIWKPKVNGGGVTVTGSPDFAALDTIELKYATTAAQRHYMLGTVQAVQHIPGAFWNATMCCVDAVAFNRSLDTVDVVCGGKVTGKKVTKQDISFEVTTDEQNFWLEAIATGTMPKSKKAPVPTRWTSTSTITAGAVTLSGVTEVAAVRVNGKYLSINTLGITGEADVAFNPTTGVLSFDTMYNGLSTSNPDELEIIYISFNLKPTFAYRPVEGTIIFMLIDTPNYSYHCLAQLSLTSFEAGDAQDKPTYTLTVTDILEKASKL